MNSAEHKTRPGHLSLPVHGMSCGKCVRKVTEALEGVEGVISERDEARRELNWLIFAAIFTAPIMPLMWLMPFGEATVYVNAALATLVQFTAGLTFYRGAWKSLKNRSANMDVLVALGITAAYGYSVLAAFRISGISGHVFFETSAMLITFIRFGKWLEARAKGKAGEALRRLLHLQPDLAVGDTHCSRSPLSGIWNRPAPGDCRPRHGPLQRIGGKQQPAAEAVWEKAVEKQFSLSPCTLGLEPRTGIQNEP